jgi:hypothetical protein
MEITENVNIQNSDIMDKVKEIENFTIKKNNGSIIFNSNGRKFQPPIFLYGERTIGGASIVFNIKVLNKYNKQIYSYCLVYRNKKLWLENFGKSDNKQMEKYIMNIVKDNVLINKLGLTKEAEKINTKYIDCYYFK